MQCAKTETGDLMENESPGSLLERSFSVEG